MGNPLIREPSHQCYYKLSRENSFMDSIDNAIASEYNAKYDSHDDLQFEIYNENDHIFFYLFFYMLASLLYINRPHKQWHTLHIPAQKVTYVSNIIHIIPTWCLLSPKNVLFYLHFFCKSCRMDQVLTSYLRSQAKNKIKGVYQAQL